MDTHPAEREAERLRVIIETLATSRPDMTMYEAAPVIFEIEKRTQSMEAVQVVPRTGPMSYAGLPFELPDSEPHTLAKFVEICPPIQAFLPHKKINAIKELRARTGVGLKEAKDGIEHFEKYGAGPGPAASSSRPLPAGASATTTASWIELTVAGQATRDILTLKSTTHYKILAIKQCRADTLLGLKEAKEGVEEWIRLYA